MMVQKYFVSLQVNIRLPLILHCFETLVKTCYLLLNLLKAYQFVLIENIRFLRFSFITSTLRDVLYKNRYQHNISQSTH